MANQRNTEAPITEYMLIAGRRVDGAGRIEVRNPARSDQAAAKAARPAWAALTFEQRATLLAAALAELENDQLVPDDVRHAIEEALETIQRGLRRGDSSIAPRLRTPTGTAASSAPIDHRRARGRSTRRAGAPGTDGRTRT